MHKIHAYSDKFPYTVCGLRKTDCRRISAVKENVNCRKCCGDPGKHTKSLAELDADYYERQAAIVQATVESEDRRERLDKADEKAGFDPVTDLMKKSDPVKERPKNYSTPVRGARQERRLTKAELAKRTAKYIERLQSTKVNGETECKK